MTDKEKEAIEDLFSLTHINGYINLYDQEKANIYTSDLKRWQNGVKVLLNLIQTQQEDIEDYQRILDTFDKREYRKRYLEEERAKRPKLLYPDADEIYQRYYEQKAEIEKKDKIIDLMAIYIDLADENIHKRLKKDDVAYYGSKHCIKEYFINKVEKESKDDSSSSNEN